MSAGGATFLALAAALGLMVGAIVLAAGLLRMGWIADLLSAPVLTGFLAGIAIHIVVSQAPGVMGVAPVTGPLPERVLQLIGEAGGTNPWALAIAGAVLAISLIVHAVRPSLPGPLGAMAAAATAVAILGLEGRGVTVIGVVHGGLPSMALPGAGLGSLAGLTPLALIIALVVMVQTAATARSFPPSPDTPPDVARDFVGVGAANLFAGLTQAFPVDASPPRTAIVAQGGGRSQLSGLTAMAVVAALLLFGADWLVHIPEAALSGVLLFVASRLVRLADMRAILRGQRQRVRLGRRHHRGHPPASRSKPASPWVSRSPCCRGLGRARGPRYARCIALPARLSGGRPSAPRRARPWRALLWWASRPRFRS